jgi:uncharacterized membrane protein
VKTVNHSEIRKYLASVKRAASALPARRRKELIEDLTEHIEVSLAERPGEVEAILGELGNPHDIAATAVSEDEATTGSSEPRNPQLVMALLMLGSVLGVLRSAPQAGQLALPAIVAILGGVVAMCLSPWWTTQRKWLTVAWLVLPNWIISSLHGTAAGFGHEAVVAGTLVEITIRAGTLVWVWRCRVAPEPGHSRFRIPRWALVLCGSAAGVFVIVEVIAWVLTIALTGDPHHATGPTRSP